MEDHVKTDHEVERVQLQEDIERLQDTLQVHSDDDEYMYDSDDDCLLINLDNSEEHDLHADEDVSNQSSFGTKSSHTTQERVTPVDDVYTTLKNLREQDGEDLPVCVESGLALNRAYQEVILNSLQKIQDALTQNRQKQAALEEEIEGGAPSKGPSNTRPLRVFMVPFFKDSSGACPPSNEDVYTKENIIKEKKVDPVTLTPWYSNQKKKLIKGVKRECLEMALKPLMAKRETLEVQLQANEANKQVQDLLKEIKSINAEIISIKKLPISDLLDLVDESKIDWMKIAILDLSGNRSFESCKLMWKNVLHPHINRSQWQKAEEAKLTKLVHKHNSKNWETIAKELGTNRSPFQCLQHYQINLNRENRGKSSWTQEEDNLLKEVVEEIKATGCRLIWEKVAIYIEGRSSSECMTRWYQTDPSLKRGSWTEKEDAMLIAAVELIGQTDWTKIQQLVPRRSPAQCRERFCNCLDPKINSGPWQYDEDKKLLLLVEKYGEGKWSNIVKELDGRTDNQALQRYKRLMKWKHLTEWFEALPESTKKAMLGKNLTVSDFKKMEKLTWEKFQSEMGVFKEDYEKQRQDQAKGELVVPRPPCVLSYTKISASAAKLWKRRVALQNLISLHIQKIRSQHVYSNRDPKELANMVAQMCTDNMQDKVASHVVKDLPGNMTVKSLIEVSQKMSNCDKEMKKKKTKPYHSSTKQEQSRLNNALRRALHALSAPLTKRNRRLGRPRKYFFKTDPLTKEQEHEISVTVMSMYCKALGINTDQILKIAAKLANEQKINKNTADFDVVNDVSTLTSICYNICDSVSDKDKDDDEDASSIAIIDDDGDGDGDHGAEQISGSKDVSVKRKQRDIRSEKALVEENSSENNGNANNNRGLVHEKNTEIAKGEDSDSYRNSNAKTSSNSELVSAKSSSAPDDSDCEIVIINKEISGQNTESSDKTNGPQMRQNECKTSKECETSNSQYVNKFSAIANILGSQTKITSDASAKALFPRKTMKIQVNWGLVPQTGNQASSRAPSRLTSANTVLILPAKSAVGTQNIMTKVKENCDTTNKNKTKIKNPKFGRITCRTLPPNTTSLKGYRTLVMKSKQMTFQAERYKAQCQKKQENRDKKELESSVLQANSSDDHPTENQIDPLSNIRKSEKFQRLKSRFESIFLWPAFLSMTSVPEVEDSTERDAAETSSLSVDSQGSKPKKYGSRKRKRHYQKAKVKQVSEKMKCEEVSNQNEDGDGQAKKRRVGRPVGAKSNSKRKDISPVRTSRRQQTRERKTYTERIYNRLSPEQRSAPRNRNSDSHQTKDSITKLMKAYVKSKKDNQDDVRDSMIIDTDQADLNEGDDPQLKNRLIPAAQNVKNSNENQQASTSLASQVSNGMEISQTSSFINETTSPDFQNPSPALFSPAIAASQTPAANSFPMVTNNEGLVPMILSFDKDSQGNIIQTLRPISDLSQIPQNLLQRNDQITSVLSSCKQDEDKTTSE